MITAGQLRAARAMLRLDQRQFANLIHVSLGAVQRFERGRGTLKVSPEFLLAIRQALDGAGIELVPSGPYAGNAGPGLRLKGDVAIEDVGEVPAVQKVKRKLSVVA